jgi:mannan endo-1,4-beta-mannosidase
MRRAVLAAAGEFGFNVLRAWAFLDQPWRGASFQSWDPTQNRAIFNDGDTGLGRLDQLIADAEQTGIRLILPLVNYWPDFGGMDQYLSWLGGGPRDRFYQDDAPRAMYRNWVQHVLTRTNSITGRLYREEPAILAWELANEPRCDAAGGQPALLAWVREMSSWVKQHDPNHLLAVGDEGFDSYGAGAFLSIPDIDFGTFHLYPEAWGHADGLAFGVSWIEQHMAAGTQAGKPMLLEEYGFKAPDQRDAIYGAWLDAVAEQGGAGALAWMLASIDDTTGQPYPDYDHFTFYGPDDVPAIRDHVTEVLSSAT